MATKKKTTSKSTSGLKVTTDSSGKITGASDSSGSYSVNSSGKATKTSSGGSSSSSSSGGGSVKYADIVAAQGGIGVNPQTGAVGYASTHPNAGSARDIDMVVDAVTGQTIKQASAPNPNNFVTMQPGEISGGVPLTLPQPDYTLPTDMADTLVAGALTGNEALTGQLGTGVESDLEKKNKALTDKLFELYGQDTGRANAQADAEKKAGVEALQKQLQDLTNQANIRAAEYDQLNTSIQGKPITMDSIVGAQAQVRLQKASEIGLLSARQQAVQGNLTLAIETANRAVDLIYAGIEEEITAKEKQLKLIQPLLNAEQQKKAQAQADQLALQKEALQEQKGVQKQALDFAYKNNIETPFYTRAGTVYRTSDGKAYSTPQEFFADGGARDFSNAPVVNGASNDKLLSVAEAKSLGVPYGTTQGQAVAMGITPSTKKASSSSSRSTGISSSGNSSSSSKGGSLTSPPKTASANNIRNWLASNWHAKASQMSYYDVWGQAADALRSVGIDPDTYDKVFWDVFRPGEYEANHKKSSSGGSNNEFDKL